MINVVLGEKCMQFCLCNVVVSKVEAVDRNDGIILHHSVVVRPIF